MTPAVTVIIVNFNAGRALADALGSLGEGLAGLPYEVIVVDNDSRDGSAGVVPRDDPRVRLVRHPTNEGFGRGVNAGLALGGAPLVLLLNPDCTLMPGAVEPLRAELDRHPRCALVGPRLLDPDGSLQASARGDPTLLTGLFGRTGFLGRLFPAWPIVQRNLAAEAAIRSGAPSVEVDWVSGACMLARRGALEEAGGFDASYFLYWEDADLCRRLRKGGWHVRYVPSGRVVHRVGASRRTARQLAVREFHRSAYRYYVTHVVPQRWHPARPVAWAILTARSLWKQRAAGEE
jgi:N-acetylglucosaminyl-diphospho-decaprenol L-rhamnosyltransferase